MKILRMIGRYACRIACRWYNWTAVVVDLAAILLDTFIPGLSLPRWVHLVILALGFVGANIQLFAETEKEKQRLQDHIDELEDQRADIRFTVTESFAYIPSWREPTPFAALELERDQYTRLDKSGLPGWIVLCAHLEGEKKSLEKGKLNHEVAGVQLPYIFAVDEADQGEFQTPTGQLFTEVDGWSDDFQARYQLPLRITLRGPCAFAEAIRSADTYSVTVSYWTKRGIDSRSKTRTLVIQGTFQELRMTLCQAWSDGGFHELAEIGGCEHKGA